MKRDELKQYEVCSLCTAALEAKLIECGFAHKWECCYLCECDAAKQAWEFELMNTMLGDACCHFGNAVHLHTGECVCNRHKAQRPKCKVPRVEGLAAGVSCKDFSKMNSRKLDGRQAGVPLMAQATSRGGSAETFNAVLQIIDTTLADLREFG